MTSASKKVLPSGPPISKKRLVKVTQRRGDKAGFPLVNIPTDDATIHIFLTRISGGTFHSSRQRSRLINVYPRNVSTGRNVARGNGNDPGTLSGRMKQADGVRLVFLMRINAMAAGETLLDQRKASQLTLIVR